MTFALYFNINPQLKILDLNLKKLMYFELTRLGGRGGIRTLGGIAPSTT